MKKVYLLICLGVLYTYSFTIDSSAQSVNDGLLWEISGKGLRQSSYLLGTHHQVCHTFMDSIPGLYRAFETVEQFLCENIPEEYAKFVANSSYLPDDSTYEKLLTEDEFVLLNEKIESFFNGGDHIKKVKPAVLIFLLQGETANRIFKETDTKPYVIPCDGQYMDYHLLGIAKQNGLECVALDEESDAFFNYHPISKDLDQLKILIHAIDSIMDMDYTSKKEYAEFIVNGVMEGEKSYKSQKLEEFEKWDNGVKEMASANTYYKEEYQRMGTVRNNNWMRKIPHLISERPSFIAVGVAHLIGDTGLISQLRKSGYQVEPVGQ